MDWQGRRKSDNVEDRRGMGTGTKAIAGGWSHRYHYFTSEYFWW